MGPHQKPNQDPQGIQGKDTSDQFSVELLAPCLSPGSPVGPHEKRNEDPQESSKGPEGAGGASRGLGASGRLVAVAAVAVTAPAVVPVAIFLRVCIVSECGSFFSRPPIGSLFRGK